MTCVSGTSHWSVVRLESDDSDPLLVVVAHLPSKRNSGAGSQFGDVLALASAIRDAESREGHDRTVLLGDLNQDPFEPGVVSSYGLHAVGDRRIAELGGRRVRGSDVPFFFNAMWNLYGDGRDGSPPATHRYWGSEPNSLFWHMYDQVLVRPSLLPLLRQVRIVDQVDGAPLLTDRGIPKPSDHLPVHAELDPFVPGVLP